MKTTVTVIVLLSTFLGCNRPASKEKGSDNTQQPKASPSEAERAERADRSPRGSPVLLDEHRDAVQQPKENLQAAARKGEATSARQKQLFYDITRNYILLCRNTQRLGKDAPELTGEARQKLLEWFGQQSFSDLTEQKKVDCEALRDAIFDYTKKDRSSFEAGRALAELSHKYMSIILDFEINGAIAKADGEPELADIIDLHIRLGTRLFSVAVNRSDKSVRPLARTFIEYFCIYTVLFDATLSENKPRPILAQLALLSLRPEEMADPIERQEFARLHKQLSGLSHCLTERTRFVAGGELIAQILFMMDKFKVTDEEFERASTKTVADIAAQMRRLGNAMEGALDR